MESTPENATEHFQKLFPDFWEGRYSDEFTSPPVNPESGKRLSSRLVSWLKRDTYSSSSENHLINFCWPNIETVESRMMIKIWLNQEDRKKGYSARRVMKPGKAIRHIFPWMTDSQIESYVDQMRLELGERQYTLKTAQDAETFKNVYIGEQCRMENPATTRDRKSLANSCMRYENIMHRDSDGNMRHPAEAYASGEFTLVYVTDNNGHIAARCVVWTKPDRPVPAPIYGVCERSMDMIQEYLDSIDAIDSKDWTEAKLDAIEHDTDQWIAPYLDLSPQSLNHEGGSLIVTRNGEIDASGYSGILGQNPNICTCQNCGEWHDSREEGGCVDGMAVCDSCYQDSNFCEYYEENTFGDVQEVILWRRGRSETQYWSDGAIDSCATRVDGEYWRTEDLLEDHEGEYITPEQVENGKYFLSDWDGEYYSSAEMCETGEGEMVSRQELDTHHGIWQQNSNGVWYQV